MRKNRGYVLVETIISLALLCIVSSGVFSVMAAYAKKEKRNAAFYSAVRILDNIVECFKCEDFSSALSFYTGDNTALTYETDDEGNNTGAEVCVLYFDIDGNYNAAEDVITASVKVTESPVHYDGSINKRVLEAAVYYDGAELISGGYAKRAENGE